MILEGINKRFLYNFISIVIWLTVRHSNIKIHPNYRALRMWKNVCNSKSKEIGHFHPILEMRELMNEMVMLLAKNYTAHRCKLTTTIHSEKRPTQWYLCCITERTCMIKSVLILDTILKKYLVKNFYMRYTQMRHKRTITMIAIYIYMSIWYHSSDNV